MGGGGRGKALQFRLKEFKVSAGPTLPRPAAPQPPRSPPPSHSRLSQKGFQPPSSPSSTPSLGPRPLPVTRTPAALCLPSPLDPGHSQFPDPPAPSSSRAAPRLRGLPFSLAPKLSRVFPSHSALGPGRYQSHRVIPTSGTPAVPISPRDLPHTHQPWSVPQTRAAVRPKGPPGLTCLSPALAYLAHRNSATGSRAILPPAQSARTRRRRRRRPRLRPGPGRPPPREPTRCPGPLPLASASGAPSWSFRPAMTPQTSGRITGTHLPLPPTNSRATVSTSAASSQPLSATTSPMTTGPPISYFLPLHWIVGPRLSALTGFSYLSIIASVPPLSLDPVLASTRTSGVLDQALVVIG